MRRLVFPFVGSCLLIPLLAGCGRASTEASSTVHHLHHTQVVTAPSFRNPPGGHITTMGSLTQRLQAVNLAKVPHWTFQTATHTWKASVIQGPNTLLVNLDAPPGPFWSELASAQHHITHPVTIIATDWPPGTTLVEAQHIAARVLRPYHITWPLIYALHAPMVPTPMAIFQRSAGIVDLIGITPSAADWVTLFNGSPKLPQKG